MRKYKCAVPPSDCSGSLCMVTQGTGRTMKLHETPHEAFKCHVKYLLKQGYKQIGAKEFQLGDGPVLVLNRPGKYGGVFRKGKTGEAGKNRCTPKKFTSGLIY